MIKIKAVERKVGFNKTGKPSGTPPFTCILTSSLRSSSSSFRTRRRSLRPMSRRYLTVLRRCSFACSKTVRASTAVTWVPSAPASPPRRVRAWRALRRSASTSSTRPRSSTRLASRSRRRSRASAWSVPSVSSISRTSLRQRRKRTSRKVADPRPYQATVTAT